MEKEGNGEETVVVNDDTKRRISPEERMEATVIKPLERDRLNKVYDYISRQGIHNKYTSNSIYLPLVFELYIYI